MNQTLELTTLGELLGGDPVNLELALRASDRLGGHVVQGHVDGTGTVASVEADGIARRLRVELPFELSALRGRARLDRDRGGQPHDRGHRGRVDRGLADPRDAGADDPGDREAGDMVNVECDVLARYVQRNLPGVSP